MVVITRILQGCKKRCTYQKINRGSEGNYAMITMRMTHLRSVLTTHRDRLADRLFTDMFPVVGFWIGDFGSKLVLQYKSISSPIFFNFQVTEFF